MERDPIVWNWIDGALYGIRESILLERQHDMPELKDHWLLYATIKGGLSDLRRLPALGEA